MVNYHYYPRKINGQAQHIPMVIIIQLKSLPGHKASFCLEDVQCKKNVTKKFSCSGFGDQGSYP